MADLYFFLDKSVGVAGKAIKDESRLKIFTQMGHRKVNISSITGVGISDDGLT